MQASWKCENALYSSYLRVKRIIRGENNTYIYIDYLVRMEPNKKWHFSFE